MSRIPWILVVTLGAPAMGDEPDNPLEAAAPRPPVVHHTSAPCFGRGYVPYTYPAAGTCPCACDRCYDPARYFRGGRAYRKQWLRRWVGAHSRNTSMLGAVPCECRLPSTGRTGRGVRFDVAPKLDVEDSTVPDEQPRAEPPGLQPGG